MTAVGDDWLAVSGNLHKARKIWGRMSSIFIREGEDLKVLGHFFQSGSAGGVGFLGRDVGPEPPDGAGPDKIS